ncbi:MAG: hypothetical protein GDA43_09690 [Hormoscilla sp. SP5CHS1]|nr:hypothetical protein [Hormoscilla sp. SP5CHS1]
MDELFLNTLSFLFETIEFIQSEEDEEIPERDIICLQIEKLIKKLEKEQKVTEDIRVEVEAFKSKLPVVEKWYEDDEEYSEEDDEDEDDEEYSEEDEDLDDEDDLDDEYFLGEDDEDWNEYDEYY